MAGMNGRLWRGAGIAAALLHVAAVAGFGWALEGYSLGRHPVALLGASGVPHALAFNLLGFVLPGALLAWLGWSLRGAQVAPGWRVRIGLQLVLLSALCFAAQGLRPLDPTDLLAPASRLHVVAWMLWWIAFVPGALLLARASGRAALVIALLVLLFALGGGDLLPAPIAQRMAFLLWFGWWLVAGRATASRVSASAPGSSPTARR